MSNVPEMRSLSYCCYSCEELFCSEHALCSYKLNLPSLFISLSFQVSAADDLLHKREWWEREKELTKIFYLQQHSYFSGFVFCHYLKRGNNTIVHKKSFSFSKQTPTQTKTQHSSTLLRHTVLTLGAGDKGFGFLK